MPQAASQLVVCGKGELACRVLGYARDVMSVLAAGWRLAAVPTQDDQGADTWRPSLKLRAQRLGVRTHESVRAVSLKPGDVLLSLQFDRILKESELNGARAFNLHFSALPRHRGCFPSMWPLRLGDGEAGATLHVLTPQIDAGPVVAQARFPIDPAMTAFELYRSLSRHGVVLVEQNLQVLLEGREPRMPQDDEHATYHTRDSIDFRALEIPYESLTQAEYVNVARSLIFAPLQLPTVRGRPVVTAEPVHWEYSSDLLAALPGFQPCAPDSAILRCRDGLVRVTFGESGARD